VRLVEVASGRRLRLEGTCRYPRPRPRLIRPRRPIRADRIGDYRLGLERVHPGTFLLYPRARLKRLEVSEDGTQVLVVMPSETAEVIDLISGERRGPFAIPQQVIHSAAISSHQRLLALGGHNRVDLFHLDAPPSRARVGVLTFRVDDPGLKTRLGDLVWIGLRGNALVAITQHLLMQSAAVTLDRSPAQWPTHLTELWEYSEPVPSDLNTDLRSLRVWEAHPELATLSEDGETVAVVASRFDRAIQQIRRRGLWIPEGLEWVAVLPTFGGGSPEFLEHHRQVSLVSFARQGRTLVTADESGRVYYWPRGDDGWLTGPSTVES
jgi:hypothetical protein